MDTRLPVPQPQPDHYPTPDDESEAASPTQIAAQMLMRDELTVAGFDALIAAITQGDEAYAYYSAAGVPNVWARDRRWTASEWNAEHQATGVFEAFFRSRGVQFVDATPGPDGEDEDEDEEASEDDCQA